MEATITTAIDSKNPQAKGNYTLSAITDTTATATGKGDYIGTVPITFTIKVATKTDNKSAVKKTTK